MPRKKLGEQAVARSARKPEPPPDTHPDKRSAKRAALAQALGDLLLAEGLEALSLRPAAARLGTSDRMLLYYFGTKAELLAQALANVSARLAGKLDALPPTLRLAPFEMVAVASNLLAQPDVRPFMALWAEVVARAVRGDPGFAAVASATRAAWAAWVQQRTCFPAGMKPGQGALALLTVIEGLSTFTALGEAPVDAGAIVQALEACALKPSGASRS